VNERSATIPVAPKLSDAMADPEEVAEARARLESAGVEYVFSCWVDLLGIPKTKPVPLSEFDRLFRGEGPQFAVHSVSMVPELGPADPDQIALADLSSLTICPWDPRLAWVFADLFFEGSPYDVCPRQVLRRQIRAAADVGVQSVAGFEPEFIVLRWADGEAVKAFGQDDPSVRDLPVKRQPFGYDAEHSLDGMPFLADVIEALNRLNWGVSNVVAEGAFSQFELDYGPADALTAADRFVLLRVLLKEIAKDHGLFVTYMAKPTDGDWRNGAHINHSFTPLHGGGNCLVGDDGDWADLTFHALGGLIRHGAALTAVACSTVNSYKGLIGRTSSLEGGTLTWAPTHICFGHNNRSAMLRLPQTRKAIENRACDMCVNPYLALALTLGASLEGMRERLDPGEPVDKPLYDLTDEEAAARNVKRLPSNLLEAIDAFDNDPLAREVLGPTMHELFVRYKRDEWQRFHDHVTDWEQAEYLRFY
jgi:glutamine synthetase